MSALRTVGLARRGAAVLIDGGTALGAVCVGFVAGLFDITIFHPAPGWFFSEWWLRYWLNDPAALYRPVIWWLGLAAAWVIAWELASGRTPGDRLVRIEVVDAEGQTPHPARIGLRALGILVNIGSFGLGWMWGFVSPGRRAFHDIVSGTCVVSTQ